MDQPEFAQTVDKFVSDVKDTLVAKGAEYVPGESMSRFHNFQAAAHITQGSQQTALWGFLAKHLISISDMVQDNPTDHSMAKWEEKLGDAIAYLLILHAMVAEQHKDIDLMDLRRKLGSAPNVTDVVNQYTPTPADPGALETVHHTDAHQSDTGL